MGERLILIPMDVSEHAEKAFNYYTKKIRMPNDRVIVLYCSEFKAPSEMMSQILGGSTDAVSKLVEDHTRQTQQLVEKLEAKLKDTGCKGHVKVVHGSPAREIVTAANEVNADLIIMASRGAAGIRRTVIGSVSDHVIHESDIPVLIVKPKN